MLALYASMVDEILCEKAEQIKRNNHSDCTPLAPIRVRALPRFWAQPIDWWIGVCCFPWELAHMMGNGVHAFLRAEHAPVRPSVIHVATRFAEPVYFYFAFFAWEWLRLLYRRIEDGVKCFNGESASPRRMVSLCFYWQEREECFFFLFLRRINVWWC